MLFRQTIGAERGVRGVGLHSGADVSLRLLPAAPGTGIVFVRTDAGGIEIPADLDAAGPSFYATVLGREGVVVSTVEHLMAALYALQVDDLRAEVNGPEIPILDGSSRPFVDLLLDAGLVTSQVPRLYVTIIRPIEVVLDDKRIAVFPCSEYRVTYAIEFDHPSVWGRESFIEKLAPARTFALEREVDALRRAGLARGGSLDNAVVVGEAGILNPPLRFDDEFVRHKMLDLTGDLSLLGRPLRGHVVAYRAGHDLHGRLARRIRQSPADWYLAPWTEAVPVLAPGA
jgi:UDP-3-O-[3-hydroxymyristoyl] N-acetylglucosamine deacetylase